MNNCRSNSTLVITWRSTSSTPMLWRWSLNRIKKTVKKYTYVIQECVHWAVSPRSQVLHNYELRISPENVSIFQIKNKEINQVQFPIQHNSNELCGRTIKKLASKLKISENKNVRQKRLGLKHKDWKSATFILNR